MIELTVSVPARAIETPTSIKRFVPAVVWEIVKLELVVVPVVTASTCGEPPGVEVGVGVLVGSGVLLGVGVGVSVDVGVGVKVGVSVGVGV